MRKSVSKPPSTPTERRLQREARSAEQRAQALALRQAGETYASIGRVLGVSLERARLIVGKAEQLAYNPHWSDYLPMRAIHALSERGLLEREESEAAHAIAQFSRRELMRRQNFGKGACEAIIEWLARHGLELQPESAQEFASRLRREREARNLVSTESAGDAAAMTGDGVRLLPPERG